MIDNNLVNYVQAEIDGYKSLHPQKAQELLTNYIKLIEQNAVLHKYNQKIKSKCKDLICADDMNTGYEPSISVFQREIDLLKGVLDSD